MERATPESLGISSENIENFITALEEARLPLHSFMLLRRGTIAAEGYWKPFTSERCHRMYSVSKTFVSAAIGVLCDEGRLALSDRVHTFFPDKLPEKLHPWLRDTTVRDLLMMASPNDGTTYRNTTEDWVASFFNAIPTHAPGTVFNYDTSATHVLGVLVERITGKGFVEYLYDKVLVHMSFSANVKCIRDPRAHEWGGSGIICTTLDLAKFALLFMNGGVWEGQQLISREYIEAAVSKQIDTFNCHSEYDVSRGYGYQVWRLRENAYGFLGMGDQLAICIPSAELLFVCTADTQGNPVSRSTILNALWNNIVNKLGDTLPENSPAHENLERKCSALELCLPSGDISSPCAAAVNAKTFELYPNRMKIENIRFDFEADCGKITFIMSGEEKKLCFGFDGYVKGEFPSKYYGDKIGFIRNTGYEYHACARWVEADKLLIRCFITDDHLGNLSITAAFKNGEVSLYFEKSAEWFLDEYSGFAGSCRGEGKISAVCKALDGLEVQYEKAEHSPAFTIDDCASIEQRLNTKICKNLFLANQQKTKFYLLMMPGEKPFKTKDLSKQINSARLSFADKYAMQRLLDISPGSLSVTGLLESTAKDVTLLIDSDLLGEKTIGVHPSVNTATLKISTEDLLGRLLPSINVEPIFVKL